MAPSPDVTRPESQALRGLRGTTTRRCRLLIGGRRVVRRIVATSVGTRELETGCGSFLLSQFCGLLRLGQREGVTTLVATTRRAATATGTTTLVLLLGGLLLLLLLVEIGEAGGTRGRSGRGAHPNTG